MIKTSKTHPLQIHSVTPPGTKVTIGMTLCPGRKGASAAGGSWDRDLDADLVAVRGWKPDPIISLVEDHEFYALGIPQFRDAVALARLPWLFAPMPDGGVPGRAFDLAWVQIGPRIREILASTAEYSSIAARGSAERASSLRAYSSTSPRILKVQSKWCGPPARTRSRHPSRRPLYASIVLFFRRKRTPGAFLVPSPMQLSSTSLWRVSFRA